MKQVILGVLLATVALYAWGFVVWALMPVNPFAPIPDEAATAASLLEHLPETGYYLLPGDDADMDAYVARHLEGPLAFVTFRREGTSPFSALLPGFFQMLATVGLLALLLRLALPALGSYGARVGFVVLAGLAAAFWGPVGEAVWWHQPWSLHLLDAAYTVVGWGIAGLVLGRFLRPEPARRYVAA